MLKVSASPHIYGKDSVKSIMWNVNIALIPLFLLSVLFFGWQALAVTAVSIATCLLFERIIAKYLLKSGSSINDGSAVITGTLLAFNLPSNLPIWMVMVGAFIAISVGKMAFGGLGKNPFNPALVGRVFLLLSFPTQMATWPKPSNLFFKTADSLISSPDATSGPTLLGMVKEAMRSGIPVDDIQLNYVQMLIGEKGGSLGEISVIAILLGGLYLLYKRVISWHIPVAFIGSAFLFATILHLADPNMYINPFFHILTGGLMLGAVFMATDYVTSPMSKTGKLIFGMGCGLLTILIRVFGALPEGVSFAILIMNALVPLINKGFKPKRFFKTK